MAAKAAKKKICTYLINCTACYAFLFALLAELIVNSDATAVQQSPITAMDIVYFRPDDVRKALFELLELPNCNGKAVVVRKSDGTSYTEPAVTKVD